MKNLGLTLFVVLVSISLINAQFGMGGLGGMGGGGMMSGILGGIMSGVMRAMGGMGGGSGSGSGTGSGSGSAGMSPTFAALMQGINRRPTDTNNIVDMLAMNGVIESPQMLMMCRENFQQCISMLGMMRGM